MRGHIIAEYDFLHQGMEHHLYVTGAEGAENEFRFEVRRIPHGGIEPETEYERVVDFTKLLAQCPNTTLDQLIQAEVNSIRHEVFAEEQIHAHDP
mgnify:CR=1 FL=1